MAKEKRWIDIHVLYSRRWLPLSFALVIIPVALNTDGVKVHIKLQDHEGSCEGPLACSPELLSMSRLVWAGRNQLNVWRYQTISLEDVQIANEWVYDNIDDVGDAVWKQGRNKVFFFNLVLHYHHHHLHHYQFPQETEVINSWSMILWLSSRRGKWYTFQIIHSATNSHRNQSFKN